MPLLIKPRVFRRVGNSIRYAKDYVVYFVTRELSLGIDDLKFLTPETAILTFSAADAANWSYTFLSSPNFFANSNYLSMVAPTQPYLTAALILLAVMQLVSVRLMVRNRRRNQQDTPFSYWLRMASHFLSMGTWFFLGTVTTFALSTSAARTVAPHLVLYILFILGSFIFAPITTVSFKHRNDSDEKLAEALPVPVV